MKITGIKFFSQSMQQAVGKVMNAKWNFTKDERKKAIAFSKSVIVVSEAFEEYRKKVIADHTPIDKDSLEMSQVQAINKAIESEIQSYLNDELEIADFDFHYDNIKEQDHFTDGELALLSMIGVYRE